MKHKGRLAIIFLAAASMLAPLSAPAMSVYDYDSKTPLQRATYLEDTITKMIDGAAKVNPGLSQAIKDYFQVVPPGSLGATGIYAFESQMEAFEKKCTPEELKQIQIETILVEIVKTEVVPNVAKQAHPPSHS